jgi:AcrR family transcriptional regulator
MTRQKSREPVEEPRPDVRANQKERTRQAVVDAATQLLRSGAHPTLAEAAALAKVSRATAYRYFPTQESLLLEVAQVNPAAEPVERWLEQLDGGEPNERLRGLLSTFNKVVLAEEVTLRTGLRQRLTPARWRKLRSALALTLGVEALVVMKDVCHVPDAEALATLDWAAQALLRAALDEAR